MDRRGFLRYAGVLGGGVMSGVLRGAAGDRRPNVVLVLTDDQGYGDVGAHGNIRIRTPNLDALWGDSVRLTDYHVDPTCAPTRSALLTGRYSSRTGVWHTIMGRSLLDPREITLADVFRDSGYATGMFGKWHLGDNAPCRPQDRGFGTALYHGGGGVGQGPDWWGNDYFDDTYLRNGTPEAFSGYCTDVWFREALTFMERHRSEPFFVYIPTNAPHGPLNVDPRYSEPYEKAGVPQAMAKFYGMIENIDENMGLLRRRLVELGLDRNTILIFMTDNGTATGVGNARPGNGWAGFAAGMRGRKGSEYDGGHRVPCFLHWPEGGLTGGRDVARITAHIDILPTLTDLCGIARAEGPPLDGISLVPLLRETGNDWPERVLFVHSQRIEHPVKWRKTAVMTDRWRLVNGTELYDMTRDPGQERDVAAAHAEVMAPLTAAYERWWESLQPAFADFVRIDLGSDAENPVRLMSHDWHGNAVWNQGQVRSGVRANGFWAVRVVRAGRYRFELYRWPQHLQKAAECVGARLAVGGKTVSGDLEATATCAVFEVDLAAGPTTVETVLKPVDGKEHGAYFVHVTRL